MSDEQELLYRLEAEITHLSALSFLDGIGVLDAESEVDESLEELASILDAA